MKFLLRLIFFTFLTTQTLAQSGFNTESLTVTRSDLEQNIYAKDSTANALVIYEVGNSYVDRNDFDLHTEIHRKIKILNRKGFDKATEEIVLYTNDRGRKETVKDIKATVYNLNDGVIEKTKLSDTEIIEEKYNDNYTIIKFTFPNIQEGSVINYSYKIISPFMYKYKSWNFQEDIPTLYSEYNTSIPGNWDYNIKLVGGRKLFINDSKLNYTCLEVARGGSADCVESKYVMKDIPAFIDESFMTTRDNYLARIEYELKTFRGFDGSVNHYTKSWNDTDKEIQRGTDFGRLLKKSGLVKNLMEDDSDLSNQNDLDKIKAIYEFVQDHYNWNGKYDLFEDVSIKDLLKEKTGTVSEINMLLYNLLVANDIDAQPILVSTRENGFITKIYPVLSDFNYVLIRAVVDGETYILDASDNYLSFGQIPYRALNQYGRLIGFREDSSWFAINPEDTSLMSYRGEMTLDDAQQLHGEFSLQATDYEAYFLKKGYFNDSDNFMSNVVNTKSAIEVDHVDYNDIKKTDDEFRVNFEVSATPELIGNKVYLNPYVIEFFTENPFQLQERSYPVDFGYQQSYTYATKINFGTNYTVESLPKPKKIALPENAGSLTVTYQVYDDYVTVYFKLVLKETIYEPGFYPYLKNILGSVVDKQKNTLIVFSKKD